MGYFPNGTAHEIYESKYCDHCRHMNPEGDGCAVMALHIVWNYERTNKTAVEMLDTLIPTEDCNNLKCRMFLPWDDERCEKTKDMFQ